MERNSYWIETLGCPKNVADSRRMDYHFLKAGFNQSKTANKADFLVINSCSFIKEAQEETIQTIFNSLKLKEKKKDMSVVLVGCFAERFASELKEEIPELDLTIGTGKFEQVPIIIKEKYNLSLETHDGNRIFKNIIHKSNRTHAFFQIAQGCSRSCAFCIIPTIRGPLLKYDIQRISDQYQEEISLRGATPLSEAVIVSQDTINQGIDEIREVIEFFSKQDSIKWIRLQYLFPDKRVLKLLDLYKEYPKLVSYLDIPFQHVNPSILKQMNRPHDINIFHDILSKWNEVRPNGDVRTSFIIGFPGETEQTSNEIISFIQKYNIQKVALFRYSHETGTPAFSSYNDEIPDDEKIKRINYIRDEHLKIRNEYRKNLIDTAQNVMIDEITETDFITRREQDSPDIDEVVFVSKEDAPNNLEIGQIIPVKLDTAMEYDWLASYDKKDVL